MITVLSWLIANLEMSCLAILGVMAIFKMDINNKDWIAALLYLALLVVVPIFSMISSAKSFWGSLVVALISACAHWFLYVGDKGIFWAILVPTLVVSIAVGIFTAIFKDAVISRRMLYVNSGVSMFEYSLLYVLNRFFSAFSCMTFTLILSVYFDEIIQFMLNNV